MTNQITLCPHNNKFFSDNGISFDPTTNTLTTLKGSYRLRHNPLTEGWEGLCKEHSVIINGLINGNLLLEWW